MTLLCAMYVRPGGGIDFGRLLQRVFRRLEWKNEYVAAVMDTDPATLSRGLNGLGPIDLHRFGNFDSRFWWKFFRALFKELLRREEQHEHMRRRA
jgi:hypothetical protein